MASKPLRFLSDFKNNPDELLPREKLEQFGVQSLALWELLVLVLRTGVRHTGGRFEDVRQLSKRLMAEGGFKGVFAQSNPENIQELYQVHRSHAYILSAISEICRRLHGKYDIFDVSTPEKTFKRFLSLKKAKQEQCFVLHVDENERCVYQELVAIGSQQEVMVTPTDILRSALWFGASKLIIVHNHPGNSAKASKADISWTIALSKGANEMHKIKIVDHIIIGRDGYWSFQEQGLL